jgi:hypothetical protein
MKTYLAPLGAAALLATLAACSGADTDMDTAHTDTATAPYADTTPTDTTPTDTTMPATPTETALARTAYVMAADEFAASDLIGDDIVGADGETIATVADVLIGNDDQGQIVFRNGGVLGIAGELGTLPFTSVSVKLDANHEPTITAALVEKSLDGVAEFEQDGVNDYRLASELIGTNAELSVADNYTRITNLLMNTDGKVNHAVVTDGVSGVAGGDRLVIAFDDVTVAQGDGEGDVIVNKTPDQLKTAAVLHATK